MAVSLFAFAGSAMANIIYDIALTENGVGDSGPDWFGTVTLDVSNQLVAADITAKGFVFNEVNIPVGGNSLDPVNGIFNTWILAGPYADGPQAGLQFWGGTSFYWSFDTDCGQGGSCGGLPIFGTYTLTAAAVPSPATLPLVLTGLGGLGAMAYRKKKQTA